MAEIISYTCAGPTYVEFVVAIIRYRYYFQINIMMRSAKLSATLLHVHMHPLLPNRTTTRPIQYACNSFCPSLTLMRLTRSIHLGALRTDWNIFISRQGTSEPPIYSSVVEFKQLNLKRGTLLHGFVARTHNHFPCHSVIVLALTSGHVWLPSATWTWDKLRANGISLCYYCILR